MYKIVQRKDQSAEEKAAGGQEAQNKTQPPPIRIATPPQRIIIERRQQPTISAAATNAIQTELAKNAAQSAAKQSPKGASKMATATILTEKPEMNASIRLIDDEMDLIDSLKEFLFENNTKYSVIGAIGAQGTGKSTILSMLAGNSPNDMYRQYIFRPAAREAVEACRFQTSKISVYVLHKFRVIFLDCQPLNCLPLLEEQSRPYRAKGLSPLESMELEAASIPSFEQLTSSCPENASMDFRKMRGGGQLGKTADLAPATLF